MLHKLFLKLNHFAQQHKIIVLFIVHLCFNLFLITARESDIIDY